MREAPSLALIAQLLQAYCRVRAYDPAAREEAGRMLRATHAQAKVGDADGARLR